MEEKKLTREEEERLLFMLRSDRQKDAWKNNRRETMIRKGMKLAGEKYLNRKLTPDEEKKFISFLYRSFSLKSLPKRRETELQNALSKYKKSETKRSIK